MPTLSPFERTRVTLLLERFCSHHTVLCDRPKVRYTFKIRGTSVTLIEERPHGQHPSIITSCKIAQFRRAPGSNLWTLHCRDQRGRWHLFEPVPASKRLDFLLRVVEEDATGSFFG